MTAKSCVKSCGALTGTGSSLVHYAPLANSIAFCIVVLDVYDGDNQMKEQG